ncbi:MAG: glycosyltransferase [Coriobacteriia bacterium]|nr:glycosyltransferase [Coriobacteriia bacterium]
MHGDSQSLVSVIVPIYNVEKYLDQCLDSIEAQTHKNIEVLCINDGSTDGSPDIIRAHAARDPRVVMVDKANGGYGQGCNMGLRLAKGDWVSVIEPDDWIEPTMYEDMLAFADGFEQRIDIVKTPWTDIRYWDDPKKMAPYPSTMQGEIPTSTAPITVGEQPKLISMHPSIWSAIYRKGFLDERQIRFPEYPGAGWADNPFLIETMCQAEAIVYLDKPYYNYRCDLPDSTKNHKTVEAVVRPFDRWDDMLAILKRLNVTDPHILRAHYQRGVNYSFGAIYDDGWDNPNVQERVKKCFEQMDPELVLSIPDLAPHRKKFFCDVLGLPKPKIDYPAWWAHLVKMTGSTIKHEGMGRFVKRVKRAVVPEEPAHA